MHVGRTIQRSPPAFAAAAADGRPRRRGSATQEKFSKRLSELQPAVAEAQELERVLAAMGGKAARKRGTSATAPARKRAGRGDRPEQFLKLVTENPGITVAQAAKKLDMGSNYLYRLAREQAEQRKVRKIDSGYHPIPADDSQAQAEATPEPVAERAAYGERHAQFEQLVRARPGITVSEAAPEMGANIIYVYRVASELVNRGVIDSRKVGRRRIYLPMATEASANA